jgi:antitoxin component YwqK of YwqJK toxin-antitoxin module
MKQHCLFLLVIIFCPLSFFAQSFTHAYYFDAGFNSVPKAKAIINGKGYYDNGLFKLTCYYNDEQNTLFGKMQFTDSSLAVLNGDYEEYYLKGNVKEKGMYDHNQKHSIWQEWDTMGRKTDSVLYEKGIRFTYAKWAYYNNPEKNNYYLYSYEITDSLGNTYDRTTYSDSGSVVTGHVHFKGQTGIWKTYKAGMMTVDTVYTRELREAEFPDGNAGWAKYLERSLGGFNPADNGAKGGVYRVIVRFIVDKDGSIFDVKATTNFGCKMEEKVIKTIKNGPKWIPASMFGRPVKAYRSQPVTFVVDK